MDLSGEGGANTSTPTRISLRQRSHNRLIMICASESINTVLSGGMHARTHPRKHARTHAFSLYQLVNIKYDQEIRVNCAAAAAPTTTAKSWTVYQIS